MARRDPNDMALLDVALGALAGLATGFELQRTGALREASPADVAHGLRWIGDVIRLGEVVPDPWRRWLRSVAAGELAGAVAAEAEAVRSIRWPARRAFDPLVSLDVKRRDESESVRAAVMAAMLPRVSVELPDAPAFPMLVELDQALADADRALSRLFDREDVEALLEARASFVGERSWLDTYRLRGDAVIGGALAARDAIAVEPPPDDVVTSWALEGRFARYVEGYAESSDGARAEIGAVLAALADGGEILGDRARAWLERSSSSASPLRLAAGGGALTVRLEGGGSVRIFHDAAEVVQALVTPPVDGAGQELELVYAVAGVVKRIPLTVASSLYSAEPPPEIFDAEALWLERGDRRWGEVARGD